MIIDVKCSYVDDPGDFIRPPIRFFKLTATIQFAAEERWIAVNHNLLDYKILDARPPWYERERKKAEQAEARAKERGERYEWPRWLPRAIPDDLLILTVQRVLRDPILVVTFDTAEELGSVRAPAKGGVRTVRAVPGPLWRTTAHCPVEILMESPLGSILKGFAEPLQQPENMLIVLLLLIFAVFVFVRHFNRPPTLDLTRYRELPPEEEKLQQGLPPPASNYADWNAEKDKEKDRAPWDR
jgi:hypothetical protein